MRLRTTLLAAVLLLGMAGGAVSAGPPTVRDLYDWSRLPLLHQPALLEVTNTRGPDPGRLRDETPGQAVLLEEEGPGCLVRISVFSLEGTLRIFLDGAAAPQVEIPLNELYLRYPSYDPAKWPTVDQDLPQVFPFLSPLSTSGAAHRNASYVPIPFARSARVVLEHDPARPWVSYSLLWRRYPAGTPVETYNLAALKQQEAEVWQAARAWRNMGRQPFTYPDQQQVAGSLALGPHSQTELWRSEGAGTIVGLRLRAIPWHRAVDRYLVLRAYWDGEEAPSVETPIGALSASSNGVRQALVLPAGGGDREGWYWCYLPMPFAAGARLTLENLSQHGIPTLDYEITIRPGTPPAEAGRFCARWKRERHISDQGRYTLLEADGAGKLVGFNLHAQGFPVPMGEFRRGDRLALYTDGEAEPAVAGPSLLMYWNHGHYTGSTWDSPLFANPEFDHQTYGAYSDYRFFLTDAPSWETSARLALEVQMDEGTGRDFSSVVSWYRAAGARDNFEPLTREALSLPVRHYPGSLEVEELVETAQFTRGDLLVVEDPDGRYGVGNNHFVSFAPLGFGDSVTFRFQVEQAGEYEVRGRIVAGPSGGFWSATLNSEPLPEAAPVIRCVAPETTVEWRYYPRGWLKLAQGQLHEGENTITFIARSPHLGAIQRGVLLGLDALLIQPVRAE